MSAQRASAPVRFARLAAAVVLTALAIAVAVRLAGRRGGAPAQAVVPPPAAGPVDLKTHVRHEEYKDGRLVAVVRGDASFVGPDGRDHLKGAVDAVNFGPGGEETSRLKADEVAYDKESLLFEIAGRVRVETGGVVLEGESFSYDKAKGLFGTTAGGRFSAKTLSGSAPEISYAEGADEVRLGEGFAAELGAAEGGGGRLALAGRSFRYARRGREGRMEGRASIRGADFRATADSISIVAAGDEAGLDSAVLEGGAEVALEKEPSSGVGEIRADRIEVTFSREPSGLGFKASGRAVLSLRPGADRNEAVTAPAVLLSFSRDDGLWTWTARGGARVEIAGSGGPGRTLEGDEAWFDGGGILHLSGAAERPAVADSAEARIEAPSIAVATASGGLLATGGVAAWLKKGDGTRRTGFFTRGEDVSVACRTLETRPDIQTTFLTGAVLVRQGNDTVRAMEIELAGDEGRMSGGGGVEITLAEAGGADGRPGRTIVLGGQDMAYRPDTRTLSLSTRASIRLPEARLEAGTLSAVLARDGRTVETLEAKKDVVVSKGRFEGRAGAAFYDSSTDRITLTRSPVLTDEKGGSARGAKLTFDLADDKILIENEGPGRATTVIRS